MKVPVAIGLERIRKRSFLHLEDGVFHRLELILDYLVLGIEVAERGQDA